MRQSYKTVLLWVVLILMFVAFYQFFAQHDRKQKELAFSDFIAKVEKGEVRDVQVKDNVNYVGVLKDGSEFHTVGPIDPMASIFSKLALRSLCSPLATMGSTISPLVRHTSAGAPPTCGAQVHGLCLPHSHSERYNLCPVAFSAFAIARAICAYCTAGSRFSLSPPHQSTFT